MLSVPYIISEIFTGDVHDLMQNCGISSANAQEILQFCIKPLTEVHKAASQVWAS